MKNAGPLIYGQMVSPLFPPEGGAKQPGLKNWLLPRFFRGSQITAGKSFGNVESVKAVSEIYAPVSGEVTEANEELHNTPEKINSDPHGSAWLVKVKLSNAAEVSALMDAPAYEAFIASEKGKEASA